ncbi:hypothetical protein SPWS13_2509 [Shewanella putrefaciens]|nr:hypothetical protein SPWS13_2509 [Shewanella putrefaciens]
MEPCGGFNQHLALHLQTQSLKFPALRVDWQHLPIIWRPNSHASR